MQCSFFYNQISHVFANVCVRSYKMEVTDVYLHDVNVTSRPGTCTPPKGRKDLDRKEKRTQEALGGGGWWGFETGYKSRGI